MNTFPIDFIELSKVTKVDAAPAMIPSSSEMNMVPVPIPILSGCDRSAVQAKSVGLEIPVAIPKTMEDTEYITISLEKHNIIMLRHKKNIPIVRVFTLPILSESDPKNRRINMVVST